MKKKKKKRYPTHTRNKPKREVKSLTNQLLIIYSKHVYFNTLKALETYLLWSFDTIISPWFDN